MSKEEILHKHIKVFCEKENNYGAVMMTIKQIKKEPLFIPLFAAMEEYANQDKWISVEDGLPKKDGNSSIYCLVNDTYNGILVRPFNEYHNCWDDEDADDYYTEAKGGKITHWQPLPNPPKQ